MSWDQEFFDPIILPGQKPLVTLRDAAQYIIKLPKAERELRQWETAIEWLMLVGENGGDPMVPRIATMKHCNGMSQILCRDLHRAGNSPKAYTLIRWHANATRWYFSTPSKAFGLLSSAKFLGGTNHPDGA